MTSDSRSSEFYPFRSWKLTVTILLCIDLPTDTYLVERNLTMLYSRNRNALRANGLFLNSGEDYNKRILGFFINHAVIEILLGQFLSVYSY